mmetsp:Transcript_124670/g.175877  ORF Transcript_124670/g.175877 Transcript_124670/m.175877 type:complete len:112 (+) Transcript_124670:576-911(+)
MPTASVAGLFITLRPTKRMTPERPSFNVTFRPIDDSGNPCIAIESMILSELVIELVATCWALRLVFRSESTLYEDSEETDVESDADIELPLLAPNRFTRPADLIAPELVKN